jgi:hypothetical protein
MESRKYAAEVFGRVLGLPPVVYDISRATYDSAEIQERVFWKLTMLPRLTQLTSWLNIALCPLYDDSLIAVFDTSQVEALQPDLLKRYQVANEMRRLGLPIALVSQLLNLNLPRMAGDEAGDYQSVATEPRVTLPARQPASRSIPRLKTFKETSTAGYRLITNLEFRAAYEKAFLRTLGKAENDSGFEGSYKRRMAKLLKQQANDVKWAECVETQQQTGGATFYDREKWIDRFGKERLRLIAAVRREGWRMARDTVEAVTGKALKAESIEGLTEAVKEELGRRAIHWAELQDDFTWSRLAEKFEQGVKEGWSLQQYMEAAETLFGTDRAERIARTETGGSLNSGIDAEYRDDPEVWGEEWLATVDDRTRDTHTAANSQVIPKDGLFRVGNISLRYPGDPDSDAPQETINCRCTILPVLLEAGEPE